MKSILGQEMCSLHWIRVSLQWYCAVHVFWRICYVFTYMHIWYQLSDVWCVFFFKLIMFIVFLCNIFPIFCVDLVAVVGYYYTCIRACRYYGRDSNFSTHLLIFYFMIVILRALCQLCTHFYYNAVLLACYNLAASGCLMYCSLSLSLSSLSLSLSLPLPSCVMNAHTHVLLHVWWTFIIWLCVSHHMYMWSTVQNLMEIIIYYRVYMRSTCILVVPSQVKEIVSYISGRTCTCIYKNGKGFYGNLREL